MSGTASPTAASPAEEAAQRRCRHCGEVVVGDRDARVAHLKDCAARVNERTTTAPASATPGPVLRPLPVCGVCGKLFRSAALLDDHAASCTHPLAKSSQTPEPIRTAGRDGLHRQPVHGRKLDAYNAECDALKAYDARMARLLQRNRVTPSPLLHSPDPRQPLSSTRSSISEMSSKASFTGGAERTVCRTCGKGVLTSMLRLHRESCVVLRLEDRLRRLRAVISEHSGGSPPPGDASPAHSFEASSGVSPRSGRRSPTKPTVTAQYALVDEAEKILSALAGVIVLPTDLRRSDGTLSLNRVRRALPVIDEAFETWKAAMIAEARKQNTGTRRGIPDLVAAKRSVAPRLRQVLHRPPADLSPVKRTKATDDTLERCDNLAATKSAAARRVDFDPYVLELAEAVRRGDMSLRDATLPNHGVFKASGYASAVSPILRE